MSASIPSVDPRLGLLVAERYRICQVLGSGGLGVVYSADDRVLRRRVALKLLRPEKVNDPASRRRLFEEGQASARIQHPRVVTVHDLLTLSDGPCIVMERVKGTTLTGLLRRRHRLDVVTATRLAIEISRALAAVHARDLIHLDVKPDNIFLSRDGLVKLGDFGLARKVTAAGITEADKISGTLPYMAPEQLAGNLLSPATDLYSLGAVYFEMLLGHKPFTGRTILDHARKPYAVRPPHPCNLDPELPRACGDLIDRTLSRLSWQRPPDATTLLADLRRILVEHCSAATS